MSFFEIVLLAVGLSMDSLAVSITEGALISDLKKHHLFRIGGIMGLFQGGMTAIGYFAGIGMNRYITSFDHWIAFLLLLYIGGKMIYEDVSEKDDDKKTNPLCIKTLCTLGFATSIDALAIGISLACLGSSIGFEALTIAVITFLFSASGVFFGNRFGQKVNLKLELIGGLILIAIGIKILIEHLCFNG